MEIENHKNHVAVIFSRLGVDSLLEMDLLDEEFSRALEGRKA